MSSEKFQRSKDVKEVIYVKACWFLGYFNADSKKFAVDPHVTSFSHIRKIVANAFNIDGPFHISYLCRDDKGEDIYLAMRTDWDLDVAFLKSSDPCLFLKVELQNSCESYYRKSDKGIGQSYRASSKGSVNRRSCSDSQLPPSWSSFDGSTNMINRGKGNNFPASNDDASQTFFPRKPPLGDCELRSYLDKKGRLVRPEELRLCVYYGGVEPSLRKVAWRLLLNVFPEGLTALERISYMERKTKEYHYLCKQWKCFHGNSYIQEIKKTIWKDVIRTDRMHTFFSGGDDNPHLISLHNLLITYALAHEDVRYCQGMSDIAAPLLVVMNNEPHAYVCFCALMTRLAKNFNPDGEIMSRKFKHLSLLLQHHDLEYFCFLERIGAGNMFFCYRWMLLEMKREFEFNDSLLVLEVMWSSLPPQPPENDLSLGILSICNTRKNGDSFDIRRSMEFPNLTLSVKNLPVVVVPANNEAELCREKPIKPRAPVSSCKGALQNTSIGPLSHALQDRNFVEIQSRNGLTLLPPPEQLGCGNPFLLFICLSVLLQRKTDLDFSKTEYADLVMHFDRMVRKHSPETVLSQAMQLFARYLHSHSLNT